LGQTVDNEDLQEEHQTRADQSRSEQQTDRRDRAGNTSRPGDERHDHEGRRDDDADSKPTRRWPLVVLGVVVLLAIVASVVYWLMTRGLESTDDAYTEGNAVAVAAKVSGYVTELRVDDNIFVHQGDLLLKIDPRDYLTAREQARASLSLARAELSSAQVDLEVTRTRAPATLLQAQAQLAQAQANQSQAQREFNRQRAVDPRATTQVSVDQATAQLQTNAALVKSAEAQVQIASLVRQTIQAAEDTVAQRQAQVAQADANLAQSEVNLSYAELKAPQDGRVTRRNVDLGTFVQAGQQVFYIVTPRVWVTANFKETQLADIRPGQPVSMAVDAYPNLRLHGHVDSIQEGSGARFSAFPAENATGNFVKIVRRVPVKIIIDSGLDNQGGLPLGISVSPTVTVR
jgi:membrane fusion protein (multidrug efflux system)